MKPLSSLRRINLQAPSPDSTSLLLHQCGYEPYYTTNLGGNYYLEFSGQFEDESEIAGYVDVSTWMNQALPNLSGLDWASVDHQVLPSLMAAYPLTLNLVHQHAPIQNCQLGEIVSDLSDLGGLPCLELASGAVLVKRFKQGNLFAPQDQKEFEGLPVPLVFCIGSSSLPIQALSQVEIGDVLLIEHVAGRVLTNKKPLFKFEFNKGKIMILDNSENEVEGLVPLNGPEPDVDNSLDRLPIELSVVLMEKTVTLAELKLLAPGEVVELSKNNILDVEIRANQKKFARGELIQLPDGQLGVEIRTIWS